MICVTGCERSPASLRARQRFASRADLHELRLDLLEDPTVPVTALAEVPLSQLIVTCRPARQGGGFNGPEPQRTSLLKSAISSGVGFVDVESDVSSSEARLIMDEAARGQTRVIRSLHHLEPVESQQVRASMDALRSLSGHVLKLAVPVDDTADLDVLRRLGASRDRPVVLVGIGPAGLLSRLCYRRFGSAWSYVAGDERSRTAQGQITWTQAVEWQLGGSDPSPIVLLGGSQIRESPGVDVYNRLFAELRSPTVYVPAETEDLHRTWNLLRELGLRGASITMPFKEHMDSLVDEVLTGCGAINTVWWDQERFKADNSDGTGAVQALSTAIDPKGTKALVLGAGGTARAVSWELAEQGATVSIWNRTFDRAAAVAESLNHTVSGPPVSVVQKIQPSAYDIVVNATSVGLDGEGCLVDDERELRGVVLLDCVAQPVSTPLIRKTIAGGGLAINGREMWLHQGASQASRWLGRRVRAEDLRKFIET